MIPSRLSRSSRRRSVRIGAASIALLLTLTSCGETTAPEPRSTGTEAKGSSGSVVASPTPPTIAKVGPLFGGGVGKLSDCTAAVVDSQSGNVLLTAAHCVSGSGKRLLFAPGYYHGFAPYGTWTVRGAYVAQAWKDALDPEADYAFLIVTPSDTNPTQSSVQMAVGGFALGHTPSPGQQVTVAGYPSDLDDAPVICATTVYLTKGYPAFDCAGYDDGTSGSPWIANYNPAAGTGMITAVIGGLNQGGCSSDASYSSPLTTTTDSVFARAESGAPPDNLPQAGSDGC